MCACLLHRIPKRCVCVKHLTTNVLSHTTQSSVLELAFWGLTTPLPVQRSKRRRCRATLLLLSYSAGNSPVLPLPSGQSPFLVSLMNWKVRKKILPLVQTTTGSSGSLQDASSHFLQVYMKELVFTQAGESKRRQQSSPQVQYVSDVFSLLFLTGWPALITALETQSKDPDRCMFSTAWLLEENNYFPETLSLQSSTQVRQTVLLTLRLSCTGLSKGFFPFVCLKWALSPLPAMSVGVKP